MSVYSLDEFVTDCERQVTDNALLSDTVHGIVPLMQRLLPNADQFLNAEHFQSDPDHYARNLVFDDEKSGLSLYTLVWNPDHIYRTGCVENGSRCVSLHLYGRAMNSFYAYDLDEGTRALIEVAYKKTRLGENEKSE